MKRITSFLLKFAVALGMCFNAFSQQSISFKTAEQVGKPIGLIIVGANLQIDLGDGTRQDISSSQEKQIFSLKGQEIKIYGEVTAFAAPNSKITSVDLSKAADLLMFVGSSNLLSTIDFSNNPKLTKLLINNNKITNVNLDNLSDLETLNCSKNLLRQLNLSHNGRLSGLNCSQNKELSEIHFAESNLLTSINCALCNLNHLELSKCRNLKSLICPINHINKIDLSANEQLELLFCAGNSISVLDFSNLNKLKQVNIMNNQINEDNMDKVINSLPRAKNQALFQIVDLTNPEEMNTCSKEQVQKAYDKGWLALAWNGEKYVEYKGKEKEYKVELLTEGNGTIEVDEEDLDLKKVPDGTEIHIVSYPKEKGYGLISLTANDEDILMTKSIVIHRDTKIKARFGLISSSDNIQSQSIRINLIGNNLQISGTLIHPISIYDMQGRMMICHPKSEADIEMIPLDELPAGTYVFSSGTFSQSFIKK